MKALLILVSITMCLAVSNNATAQEVDFYSDLSIHELFPGEPDNIQVPAEMIINQVKHVFFAWYADFSYQAGDQIIITPPDGWTFSQCTTAYYGPELDQQTPTVDVDMNLEADGFGQIIDGKFVYTLEVDLPYVFFNEPWDTKNVFELCVKVQAPGYEDVGNVTYSDSQGYWGFAEIISKAVIPVYQPSRSIQDQKPMLPKIKPQILKPFLMEKYYWQ